MNKIIASVSILFALLVSLGCAKDSPKPSSGGSGSQPTTGGSGSQPTTPGGQSSSISVDIDTGGKDSEPNTVFLDFSALAQTPSGSKAHVDRNAWDLACYNVGSDFYVLLNATVGASARKLTKTDFAAVNADDQVVAGGADGKGVPARAPLTTADIGRYGGASPLDWAKNLATWAIESPKWIDDPTGDFAKTAIAVPATATEANAANEPVYLVHRGFSADDNTTSRGWKKVKVLRKGTSSYLIQYADFADPTPKEITVDRSADYTFSYVSFDRIAAEKLGPHTGQWDIAITTSTSLYPFGPGISIPYFFEGVAIQNRYDGVKTAEVLTSSVTYEAFGEANLASVTFSNAVNNIFDKWRTTGGGRPGPGVTTAPAGVQNGRFYVVEDPAKNVYKVRFTSFRQGGAKYKHSLEFALVKKGS